MKNADKLYMGRVAALGCALCHKLGYGHTPAQVHHIREGQGMSQRASNYLTVPLCEPHHTGSKGIHGDRSAFKLASEDEMSILAWTLEQLNT